MKKRPVKKKTASRRYFIRIPFEKGRRITVRTELGAHEYEPIDVSVYGISFIAISEAANVFQGGMKLDDVIFYLKDHRIQVTARVAYVRRQPKKDHFKVALEFLDVKADDVFLISKHIAEVAGLNAPKTQVKVRMSAKKKPKLKTKPKARPKTKSKPQKRASSALRRSRK